MSLLYETPDEQINFQIRQIESVLDFVKTHIASGSKEKAEKEAQNLDDEVWRLRKLLKTK